MSTFRKAGLVLAIALAALAGLVVLVLRSSEPAPMDVAGGSSGPAFELRVEKPRMARPLFGILPAKLEEQFEPGGELRIDHTSPGAEPGAVDPHHLALRADGWELLLETDDEGKITPETRLVYPMVLAERPVTLRCRPADGASGYLRAVERAGVDAMDGSFLVECAVCENVATGKVIEWPPAALTVSGRFAALPRRPRQ